ncbi:MAG: Ig-like domain-containing protein, partial [Bifidobacteriaceae bacterium]|nr:Ig-like domain-containing protein [Bifidobacteriaceae bacterium]
MFTHIMPALRKGFAVVTAGALAATLAVGMGTASQAAQLPDNGKFLKLSKATWEDRIFAMWQAENIANWTGLTTENQRPLSASAGCTAPPAGCFWTDADWGVSQGRSSQTIGWVVQDVSGGDDDTDIEYSYLHEMANEAGNVFLTAEEVAHVWNTYISRMVWFSDSAADLLMERNVMPPSSSLNSANQYRNIIDVNLVVESFGAYTPGRPDLALQIGQLPIRAVAGGFTTHAGQFEVALYSLAPLVDPKLSGLEQVTWLIDNAKAYLPADSRATEIINWVEDQYFNHPTATWEGLRDKIAMRYHYNAAANGFHFITNIESMINLGAQVAELLWSQGDLTDAIRIGALFGYDSDNPTASNAGLIGLMKGSQYVQEEMARVANAQSGSADYYPGPNAAHTGNLLDRAELLENLRNLPERYNVFRTRDNLPDYLPGDSAANDTYSLMAKRSIPLVDQAVKAAGGTVTATHYTIPLVDTPADNSYETLAAINPDVDIYMTSANNQVRAAGGTVDVVTNLVGDTALFTPWRSGSFPAGRMAPSPIAGDDTALIADGFDQDTRGLEEAPPRATIMQPNNYYRVPFFAGSSGVGAPIVSVLYDRLVEARSVRLIGGGTNTAVDYVAPATGPLGGWITDASVEVRLADGSWRSVPTVASRPIDPAEPFQQVDLVFESTLTVSGVRVTMTPDTDHVNITEVDVQGPSRLADSGFDVSAGVSVVSGTSVSSPVVVGAGELLTPSFTATNTGDAVLSGLVVRDGAGAVVALPVSFGGSLAPGESVSVVLDGLAAPVGGVSRSVSVVARLADASPVAASGTWFGRGVAAALPVGDSTAVVGLLDAVAGLDRSLYTDASWAAVALAVEAGQRVVDDASSSPEAVAAAVAAIRSALGGLTVESGAPVASSVAARAALGTLVGDLVALDASKYTPESWAKVRVALASAASLLADSGASSVALQSALAAVSSAVGGLVVLAAQDSRVVGVSPVIKVKTAQSRVRLAVGKSLVLPAKAYRQSGEVGVVSWKSSNTKVAVVSKTGRITGKGSGSATVTASSQGVSVDVKVTVTRKTGANPKVASVSATGVPKTMAVGQVGWVQGSYGP